MTRAELRRRLAELVAYACGGEPSAEEVERAGSLTLAGVSSLDSLRVIDTVEQEFGVLLRIDQDPEFLDSVDGLLEHLVELGIPVDPERGGVAR
ncbi:acyl carrier protein [Micromonospora sp. HM5-17]|uniref:acyl carrier protein n=1 Tax=Micromonospora sp. HM5-17 TaxID=2487710 RepID=UPI000F463A09|nr:acyl carrier protein [Micromonospora sp. HM5-17]ROT28204.1 acyl carrier protein [Micromonospora sp. HM5-17]